MLAYRGPRLGVAVFAPGCGLGKGGCLGVEVARLGVGLYGELGGGGRRPMPRRGVHGAGLEVATPRHQGGCLGVDG
ncbi:hypothetical protein PIB30_084298, partial [Stylosanthes scabra]|nr:hypothetical protein [Stylosanthes scabra]